MADPGARLAQGREAEVFDPGDGTVLKLFRRADAAPAADREAAVLEVLASAEVAAPRLVDRVVDDGRPGLVLTKADGTDWLRLLGQRPLTVWRAGRRLAAVHVAIHAVTAPPALPSVRDHLRLRLERSEELDPARRAVALAVLETLPNGAALCHGDFHFENVLGGWRDPVVIDWGAATRGTPPADVARTLMILGYGEPPDHAHPLVRRLAPAVRSFIVRDYLATYRRSGHELRDLEAWRLVQLAARLGETTPTETAVLRDQLDEAIRARTSGGGTGP